MERHEQTAEVGKRAALPRVRVGAFLTHEDRLLLVRQQRPAEREEAAGYWLLPGGGVRFGESLAEALTRELFEELGLRVQAERPLAMAESISPDSDYAKHVLHILYLARPSVPQTSAPTTCDPAVLEARYFAADELAAINVRPPVADVLARFLQRLPSDMEYLGRLW